MPPLLWFLDTTLEQPDYREWVASGEGGGSNVVRWSKGQVVGSSKRESVPLEQRW